MKITETTFGIIAVIVLAMVLGFSQTCRAGAWTQKKDGAYVRFALNYYYAKDHFDSDGDRREMPGAGSFWDINTNAYCEYGLMDNLTLITSLYYKYLEYEDNTIETKSYGISDVDLGVKYKIFDGDLGVVALQGLVKMPELYDEDDRLPLGNGQYDTEVQILYGRSLWPHIPGYVNCDIGYRFRSEAPSDELRYLFEFGMDFPEQWYSRVKLDGILSMENGDSTSQSGKNPTITPEFDLIKLDIVLGYKVTARWGVEVGIAPDIYGENTSAGTRGTLAVTYKRE